MSESRTNTSAREDLLKQAMEMAGNATVPAVIDAALVEYMRHLRRQESLRRVHTFDFVDDFDERVKAMRRPRSEKRNAS